LRAIESALVQSMPPDEIIVVDDGSKDGTFEAVCGRYGSEVAVVRQENQGVSAARNRGVREARSDWIAFLDSDDVWLPTKLERQFQAVRELGSEFGACFTDCEFVGDARITLTAHADAGFKCCSEFSQIPDPSFYLLGGPPIMYAQTLLVLRSLVERLNGFDEAMPISEDLDLLFRLTFETKFCCVSTPLVKIDRTPSRPVALTEMYSRRDDRKYQSFEWLYTKWLSLPGVRGTTYEQRVVKLLQGVYYDSLEAKIHEIRMGPALREIGRLRALGDSYKSIITTLLAHKLAKLRSSNGNPRPSF
jgi:glycosyltransferase involved in cell wall biosynthesis